MSTLWTLDGEAVALVRWGGDALGLLVELEPESEVLDAGTEVRSESGQVEAWDHVLGLGTVVPWNRLRARARAESLARTVRGWVERGFDPSLVWLGLVEVQRLRREHRV